MKKNLISLIICLTIFFPSIVHSMTLKQTEPNTPIKYEDAKKAVQETMKSYYIRGPYIQYNNSKAQYPATDPENATSQDMLYTVCGAFTYTVNNKAFGMKSGGNDNYPSDNIKILSAAAKFYNENIVNSNGDDGKFLIYYESSSSRYIYGDNNPSANKDDFETVVNQLQPGDLLAYTGHALMVYDVIRDNTGKIIDALIINSNIGPYVVSKIDGTQRISFHYKKGIDNNFLKISNEGTIQLLKLSTISGFVNQESKDLKCSKAECAIIRTFYNKNGNTVFNYTIDEARYKKTKLKVDYPGLYVEKTNSVGDNTSINVGDEIEYTLIIKNNSNISYTQDSSGTFTNDGTTYNNIIVKEWIPGFYEGDTFYSKSKVLEGSLNTTLNVICSELKKTNRNEFHCEIKTLKPGEEVKITYKIKVNKDYSLLNKTLLSKGTLYKKNTTDPYITIGEIKNNIERKTDPIKNLNECYTTNSQSTSGLELIDKTYKCAYGTDLDFGIVDFNFDLLVKMGTEDATDYKNGAFIKLNDSSYKNIILNNSFSGIIKNSNKYYLPRWKSSSSDRINTLYDNHFEEGDILIYTVTNDSDNITESGMYSYIYIDGKFKGKNKTSGYERELFTSDYYKDNLKKLYTGELPTNNKELLEFLNYQTLFAKDKYVILRPKQIIKQVSEMTVDTSSIELNYLQNSDKLNLEKINLDLTYNDGEAKQVKLNDSNVSVTGFDNSKVGKNTITVSYLGKSTTFDVNIVSKKVEKIEITTFPNILKYTLGKDKLDLTGGILTITYNDNSTEEISIENDKVTFTGFDNSVLGKQTITVSYEGKSTSYEIEVVKEPNPPTGSFINILSMAFVTLIAITSYIFIKKHQLFKNI